MRGLLALAVLALLSPVAQGGAVNDRVKTTKRGVEAIGMDGPLVAYDLSSRYDPGCNKLYVWNVNTNGGSVVSGDGTCEADDSSTGAGVIEIAVAGKQVAWIANEGGNTESDDYLYTATLPKPKEKELLSAFREGDVDQGDFDGDWIRGLVGDGGVLAVGSFTTDGEKVSRQKLRRISGTALRVVATGGNALTPAAAGAAGIVVIRERTVGLYSPGGRLLRTFLVDAGDAALTGSRLVLQSKKGLQVFDTKSGRLMETRRVSGVPPSDLDAEGDVAVYAVAQRISAIRLSTGKSAVLAVAPGELVGLEVEPAGVVYAYNTRKGGHLVLKPMAQVMAALR
jgi:hypothetical protein